MERIIKLFKPVLIVYRDGEGGIYQMDRMLRSNFSFFVASILFSIDSFGGVEIFKENSAIGEKITCLLALVIFLFLSFLLSDILPGISISKILNGRKVFICVDIDGALERDELTKSLSESLKKQGAIVVTNEAEAEYYVVLGPAFIGGYEMFCQISANDPANDHTEFFIVSTKNLLMPIRHSLGNFIYASDRHKFKKTKPG